MRYYIIFLIKEHSFYTLSMFTPFTLGIIGSICSIIAYWVYIIDIFRGYTRPHAFSWLPWGILALLTAFIQFQHGAGWATSITFIGGICQTGIFLLSLKYGEKKITQKDWVLLIVALIILIFWSFTKEGFVSIVLVCLIDTIALYFTWEKSYKKPYEEYILSYLLWTFGFLFSILAVEVWSPVNWFYPAFLLCTEWSFVLFLLWRRQIIKQ